LEQKFYALVNLVRLHPVEDLVSQLQTRKIISKEQVIRESKNQLSIFGMTKKKIGF